MTNPVIHFEIGGRDLARMTSFYGQLFGWRLQPAGPDYTLVMADDSGPGIGGGLMRQQDMAESMGAGDEASADRR
ncbi:hypothetical protein ACWCOV_25805 [Kribbella sp. NPDC002412]